MIRSHVLRALFAATVVAPSCIIIPEARAQSKKCVDLREVGTSITLGPRSFGFPTGKAEVWIIENGLVKSLPVPTAAGTGNAWVEWQPRTVNLRSDVPTGWRILKVAARDFAPVWLSRDASGDFFLTRYLAGSSSMETFSIHEKAILSFYPASGITLLKEDLSRLNVPW